MSSKRRNLVIDNSSMGDDEEQSSVDRLLMDKVEDDSAFPDSISQNSDEDQVYNDYKEMSETNSKIKKMISENAQKLVDPQRNKSGL